MLKKQSADEFQACFRGLYTIELGERLMTPFENAVGVDFLHKKDPREDDLEDRIKNHGRYD